MSALILLGPGGALAASAAHVVVLFGSSDVGVWQRVFTSELLEHPALLEGQPPLSLTTEYLGLHGNDDDHVEQVADWLALRQRQEPARVIVAVQGVAARFLSEYGDDIYPGVPRLYVVPGRGASAVIRGQPGSHVISSAIGQAIEHTMSLIGRVMPEVSSVLVVGGAGELDSVYTDYAHMAVDRRRDLPPVEYVVGLDLATLRERLAAAPRDAAVLLLTYEGDPAGHAYRTALDVLPSLIEVSPAPIFAVYDSLLGGGVVGGAMTSTERYGRLAAETLLAMLDAPGEPLPAAELAGPPIRIAFDAQALARYGLSPADLPAGSELINDTRPAYLNYLWQILAGLAVIVGQALLIVGLWRLWRQRARAARILTSQARDLARQKVLFESVINSIPDAIVVTAVDGVVIATNDHGFVETFGYAPRNIAGQHCRILTPEGIFNDLPVSLQRRHGVSQFHDACGSTFPGEWLGTQILTGAGERLGFVLLVRNVAERIAHEEERRQAHKMEALGSLAGGIAHDFNNILAVILGNAELIQAGTRNAGPHADQIVLAGNRARGLIGQILAFSRGGASQTLVPVNVRALLDETIRFVETSLPEGIVFEQRLPVDADLKVQGNASQLQQVLMNLCLNARDAIGAAGRLTIGARQRRVEHGFVATHGLVRPGRYVCIDITDDGSGMSPALQQRVFDPFFTTKAPGRGTGMGLALVYGIMQAHSGAIDLVSEPGKGSCFTLYLPMLQSDPAAREPAAGLPVGDGERVLLIDDDPAVLAMMEETLLGLNYRVSAFARSREALLAFEAEPQAFAAAITDRTMPHPDGFAVCRTMRRLRPDMPLIVCSGRTEALDRPVLEDLGHALLLVKPYRMADLATSLRELLDGAGDDQAPAAVAG